MNPKIDRLIRKGDDPVLHRACDPVAPGEHLDFLDTMERVCKKAPGAGLAAPQIGVAKRVIYTHAHDRRGVIRGRFMVNPVIVAHGDEMAVDLEGCLSYPGVWKRIRRHTEITVRYETATRQPREEAFTGYEARVIQHEVDHLDGVCKVGDPAYVDDATAAAGNPDVVRPRRSPANASLLAASLIGLAFAGSASHR